MHWTNAITRGDVQIALCWFETFKLYSKHTLKAGSVMHICDRLFLKRQNESKPISPMYTWYTIQAPAHEEHFTSKHERAQKEGTFGLTINKLVDLDNMVLVLAYIKCLCGYGGRPIHYSQSCLLYMYVYCVSTWKYSMCCTYKLCPSLDKLTSSDIRCVGVRRTYDATRSVKKLIRRKHFSKFI